MVYFFKFFPRLIFTTIHFTSSGVDQTDRATNLAVIWFSENEFSFNQVFSKDDANTMQLCMSDLATVRSTDTSHARKEWPNLY